MHDSDAPEPDYLRMILTKTRNDRLLAYTIFSQLFDELPQQLDGLQQAARGRRVSFVTVAGRGVKCRGCVRRSAWPRLRVPIVEKR